MATINLKIITQNGILVNEPVDIVVVRIMTGYIGIIHSHTPLVSSIVPSEMYYRVNGEKKVLHIQGGLLQVQPEFVKIIADEIETDEDRQRKLTADHTDKIYNAERNAEKSKARSKRI